MRDMVGELANIMVDACKRDGNYELVERLTEYIRVHKIGKERSKKMKIFCKECGNQKNFTLIKEVELEFDPKKGIWDEKHPTVTRGVVYCRECDQDQTEIEIVVS